MKKSMRTLALVTACAAALAGCGGNGNTEKDSNGAGDAAGSEGKVACIFGVGGLGDQSFNDLINEGLKKAENDLGIDYDYAEPSQVSDFELYLRDMASTGEYKVIISVGFDAVDALTTVSQEFPEQEFALIDSSAEGENIASYSCKEEEGAFLIGALTGLMLNQPDVYGMDADAAAGFVGAMDTPIIDKFYSGYTAGIGYINPDAKVLKDFIAGDNPFSDTATAKEIAISQHEKGAGIIFHAAGGSGLGVFEAANEYDFLALGCNSNQNIVNPDRIAASMLKRVDTAAYDIAKAACIEDSLALNTTVYLGVADEGLDYTLEGSNIKIREEDIQALEEIKQKVIDGELTIPTTEEEVESFMSKNQYGTAA